MWTFDHMGPGETAQHPTTHTQPVFGLPFHAHASCTDKYMIGLLLRSFHPVFPPWIADAEPDLPMHVPLAEVTV